MNTEIVSLAALTISGIALRTDNQCEANDKTAQFPRFWQRFYQEIMPQLPDNRQVYAVYHEYVNGADGLYTVVAGTDAAIQADVQVKTQAGKYRRFTATGELPAAVIGLWQQVWAFYAAHPEEKRLFFTDIEHYETPNRVSVYIGIK